MRVIPGPGAAELNLSAEIAGPLARLEAAARQGYRFLTFTVQDPLEAARWILASFHSSLAVVPLAPMPSLARAQALAQLPEQSWIDVENLPPASVGESGAGVKPLSGIWSVIFSSGSTGTPKGIALSGEGLRAAALAHAAHSGAGTATWLLDLSLAHVGGFSVLSRAHFLGVPVALGAPRFQAAATLEWLRTGKIHGLSVVPTTLSRLLREPSRPEDFKNLQLVLLGGAPAEEALVQAALAKGLPVRRTYGMTENASQAATERKENGGLEPLPGVSLRVSEDGEIELRSAFLAEGYFREGKLEALPLREGFFPTGDLGSLENGRLRVNGRRNEMIKSGGLKIFPAEIENALEGLHGVTESAAFGVPDAEWGEAVCLVVVGPGLSPEIVRAYLEPRLDRRKLPKRILLADALPRSATGKVLRAALRARILGAP
jgi:O-succinylbenzoic acid--CoA ligase